MQCRISTVLGSLSTNLQQAVYVLRCSTLYLNKAIDDGPQPRPGTVHDSLVYQRTTLQRIRSASKEWQQRVA